MRRAVAHLFVDDLAEPALSDKDLHHLSRVLRLRPGEVVTVSDGQGGSRLCEWVSAGGAALRAMAEATWDPPSEPAVTVGFALTKGEHPEWAVQKLTEAGVDHIVLVTAERCVTRWASSAVDRQLERLREVARQAGMQSRRSWLPTVEGPVAFSTVVSAGDGTAPLGVALAVQGGGPLTLATPTVLVGPEGGWSDAELGSVPVVRHVGLGPNTLRAETAAMAAGVLLVALRAGLVSPAATVPGSEAAGGPRPA
ncbi:MAG TPA: RsmE family RNA methyltransferase [Acidimicrobiales bacterium]|nr:RsmE family RNA methyltransferase [Acidimicrobiales bacterium]